MVLLLTHLLLLLLLLLPPGGAYSKAVGSRCASLLIENSALSTTMQKWRARGAATEKEEAARRSLTWLAGELLPL